jgi:hypothetical protein
MKGRYPIASATHEKRERPSDEDINLMAERVANGLDIWSGSPLTGQDADNWVRVQDEAREFVEPLTEEEFEDVVEAMEWLRWSILLLRNE